MVPSVKINWTDKPITGRWELQEDCISSAGNFCVKVSVNCKFTVGFFILLFVSF